MSIEKNTYKKAISHTVIYGVSDVLRKIVGFIMLPIYTHYLTPKDYGAVEMMMMVVMLVEVFLAMRMGQAIFRYYCTTKDDNEKKAVMSSTFLMTFCTSTLAFLILRYNANKATEIFLGDLQYADLMAIIALLLVLQAIEEIGLIYVRAQQRAVLFLGISVTKMFISLSLNIYFIVFLKLTVAGIVYSSVISTALMAVFSTIYTFYHAGFRFSKSIIKKLVLFSYPLWFAAMGSIYTDSAVKYFLRIFSGLGSVGIYILAAQFASLVLVFIWVPFSNVWQTLRYEVYEMPNPNQIYKNIFIGLVLIFAIAGLGLSLFSETVIHIMADKAFWSASGVVPILVVGYIALALSNFNNFGILLKNKTGIFAVATYINAIAMTVGFVVLIPIAGFYGAAITFLIGSISQLIWIEWKSKKLYHMQLPWWRVAFINITWLVCYSFSLLLPSTLIVSIILKFMIFIGFILLMFTMPILEKNEKEQIIFYIKSALLKASRYFPILKTNS